MPLINSEWAPAQASIVLIVLISQYSGSNQVTLKWLIKDAAVLGARYR